MTKVESLEALERATLFLRGSINSIDLSNCAKRIRRILDRWNKTGLLEDEAVRLTAWHEHVLTLTRQNFPGEGLALREAINTAKGTGLGVIEDITSAIEGYDGDKAPSGRASTGRRGGSGGPRMVILGDESFEATEIAKSFMASNYSIDVLDEGRAPIVAWVKKTYPSASDKSANYAARRIAGVIKKALNIGSVGGDDDGE